MRGNILGQFFQSRADVLNNEVRRKRLQLLTDTAEGKYDKAIDKRFLSERFEVGRGCEYDIRTALICTAILLICGAFFSARFYFYDKEPGMALVCGIIFALATVILHVTVAFQKLRKKVAVDGLSLEYRGRTYTSSEISKLIVTTEGVLKLYDVKGRRICRHNYADPGVHKLLRWARLTKIETVVVKKRRETILAWVFLICVLAAAVWLRIADEF